MLRDPLSNRALREAAEGNELAAREDGRRERAELARHQHEYRVGRRLLEILQQGIGRVLVHALGVEDEVDATLRLEGAHVQVVPQCAHVVDADHLPERLENIQVRVGASLDTTLVTEQRRGECDRRSPLSDAIRAVQEVGVRGLVHERRLQQPLRLELLRH